MGRRFTLVLAVVLALATLSFGQMRGGLGRPAHSAPHSTTLFGPSSFHHHRSAYPRGYYLGDGAFYYDDYPFEPAQAAPPQLVFVPAPPAADTPQTAKPGPLLIELQGNRYVRYGGAAQPTQPDVDVREVSILEATSRQTATPPQLAPPALLPAVLVYRDGQREEVVEYAIVGRVIYAHNHDAESSYGLKNIELSALDIPATMKANRENGVTFVLPAGPNEVVTRP